MPVVGEPITRKASDLLKFNICKAQIQLQLASSKDHQKQQWSQHLNRGAIP